MKDKILLTFFLTMILLSVIMAGKHANERKHARHDKFVECVKHNEAKRCALWVQFNYNR